LSKDQPYSIKKKQLQSRPKKKTTQKRVYFGSVYNMSAFLFCDIPTKDQAHQKTIHFGFTPQLINTTIVIGTHDINRELSV
jgi:hypothetical protein